MYVIRGAVDAMPYNAGCTIKNSSVIWHWTSDKYFARQYTSWIVATIVKDRLLCNGITSHATIERL